ncbi:MAG: peptide deformylase [Desulfobacteraceae bacterium]|nr:MAG: peptide deformylase [Desulfobacteraceae bacterium]
MAIRDILLLGNPRLYEVSEAVQEGDLKDLPAVVADLHDTLLEFRRKYGAGRAIAACQIGFAKRLIYMFIDRPVVFVNPSLENRSEEMIEVWDDCMCFPDLLVKVRRHKNCTIRFRDLGFQEHTMKLEDDLSELLQHEYDHLDGVLAVSRAIHGQAFALRSQRPYLK